MSGTSKTSRGFTLIELLVVIAIIGILSAVILTSLNSARTKARDARRISDIKEIQLALELFYDSYGAYPTPTQEIATTGTGAAGGLVGNGYMSSLPKDPSTNANYSYAQLTSGTGYVLAATLEDSTNSVLTNDVDAATGGITCTDPVYCVTS